MIETPEVLHHIVLISFKPETTIQKKTWILERYQSLAEDCGGVKAGILFFVVDLNLDICKGVELVEIAIFRDNDALQTFRAHPKHKELMDVLREVADWQVGDVRAHFPEFPGSPNNLQPKYLASIGSLEERS